MILEDLRGYLLANSIAPVYISFEPASSGITLYLYPGRQADPWNSAYHYYSLQVVSRFPDFQTSQTIIRQVQSVLTNLAGIVGSTDIVNCYPKQDPYQLGYDEQKQARLVQNYDIEAKEDTSIDPQGYVVNGSYSVNWENIYNTPTTLSGYGITDGGGGGGIPSSRTLSINGIAYDLSANRSWLVGDLFSYSGYANPSWITSLDYGKLINVPAISGTGTVTSVALSVPSILSVTGSPVTSSGTLALSLAVQAANRVLAGPTSGLDATPTFRALVAADIPAHSQDWSTISGTPTTLAGYGIVDATPQSRAITINGLAQNLSADRTWVVGDIYASGFYSNPAWITALAWSKITGTPTTLAGYGITDPIVSESRLLTINGLGQTLAADRTWNVGNVFTTSAYLDPAWLVSLDWGKIANEPTTLAGYGITDATPNTRAITINGLSQNLTADRSWGVGDVFTTSAYVNPAWITSLPWSKITATPTTLAGYGITDSVVLESRLLTINGIQQSLAANRTWSVGDVYTTSAYLNPSWIASLDYGKLTNVPATSGTGTVYYVGLSAPNIFSVTGSPIVSSGTLALSLSNQSANTLFAGPTTGADAAPTFRTLVANDIPAHNQAWSTIQNTPITLSGYGIVDAVWISGAYSNPTWLTSLAWSKITGTPTTLAGYGITDSLVLQTRLLTINGVAQDLTADRTWSVGNVYTTSSYLDPSWLVSLDWSKITNEPTTLAGYGITDGVSTTRTITINGLAQSLAADRTWSVGDVFTTSSYINPAWLVSIPWSKITSTPTTLAGYGITDAYTESESDARYAPITYSGTVRYVGLSLPASIFDVTGSPVLSSGTITATLDVQASGTVFAGPTTGSDAQPTFRTLVLADLPDIPFAAITNRPTTLAGYGIADAYTQTQSDARYVPSGLYPPLAMYWTSSGAIYFVAHSGMALGFPYLAGSGTLVYERAFSTNQTSFSAFTFPVYLSFNDILRVTCSANIGTYRAATFPRIA
jgi:hypothetical protein